ncbi:hypothetical protein WJX75_001405 [Coccomyxa subellipsoidea]|uniref:Uncharacterized protein n=1 Tax=Coccomyxa subellipsoidea TaxID=248742 RepID=A0ABR2YKF6_9CHLO
MQRNAAKCQRMALAVVEDPSAGEAGESVALMSGWRVTRTQRTSGRSALQYDYYYHPPEDFVAIGRHQQRYRSLREVARAHGLGQSDDAHDLPAKTVPAKRRCSSVWGG